MTTEFIMPDVGEGIVECEIVEWLVKEGDFIVEDQPVADVQTDKALIQIPSKFHGRVNKLHYAQGEIAKVHSPLFSIDVEGDTAEAIPQPTQNQEDDTAVQAKTGTSTSHEIIEFLLPDIGEGVVECELVEWLVNEGETIAEDQAIAEVQTDKALVQIPSMHHGVIHQLHYKTGEIARVHQPLFSIKIISDSESVETIAPIAAANQSLTAAQTLTASNSDSRRQRIPASPAVRRIVRENNLDLAQISGTGKNGRVLKEDVVNFITTPKVAVQANSNSQGTVEAGGTRVEAISGIKAAMARQMMASVQTIPHFTYAEEIDLTELVALRARLKPEFEALGAKLTMMPFFIKALSLSLQEFDILNAHVNEVGNEITYHNDHNIGMAVDTPKGLFVPNIKQVQNLSLLELSQQVNELAELGRSGRLGPNHLKGGTITISNIGAIGGTVTTPIINKPEVAIVGLGRMQTLPRFDTEGQVQARKIMSASWSGDHRVIDGGIIARFCNLWKSYLEQPERMLIRMK